MPGRIEENWNRIIAQVTQRHAENEELRQHQLRLARADSLNEMPSFDLPIAGGGWAQVPEIVAFDRNGQSDARIVDRLQTGEKAIHSTDFTTVKWFGEIFTFAIGVQSSVVKVLWNEWERSGLPLHQATIGGAIDAEQLRVDKSFRGNTALGTMIQSAGDGRYMLVPPPWPKKKIKNSRKIPSLALQKPR